VTSGLKKALKRIARHTIGRLPAPASRLSGALALEGGERVRDTRLRPWAEYNNGNWSEWFFRLRPALRAIVVSGKEGAPQSLAQNFAARWAEYCGCRYGLLLPHGTDALRIALAAALDHYGLDYGGEVIVPNLSFIASANAALDRRFGLVFVDVDPDTLLLDPKRVEEAIIPGRTRAIMPVHLFGQPADMTALAEIAKRYKLKLIEDAAQAHGSVWETGPCGSLGDAAGFSFQSHKNLTCGEGGALTTNDRELFERAYSMHNVGRSLERAGRWEHVTLGWNCRATEYQAAVLLARLDGFERCQEIRRRNFTRLRDLMEGIDCLQPLGVSSGVRKHGVHMFVMRYKQEYCDGVSIEDFLRACGAEGTPVHRGYECTMSDQLSMQKLMAKHPEFFRVTPTPVADAAVREMIYIPQDILLGTDRDMTDIAAAFRKVQRHYLGRATSSSAPGTGLIAEPEMVESRNSGA
jgi:dTDP-4-amino-4,6-dideoxygalactose transaminase